MNLGEALTSRAAIDGAKGNVMSQRTCGPDEAVEHLRRISRTEHRKRREVAQDLVDRVTAPRPTDGQAP
jgi:AmiR/NasT family two-component response regulator